MSDDEESHRIAVMRVTCMRHLYLQVPVVELSRDPFVEELAQYTSRASPLVSPDRPVVVPGISRLTPLGSSPRPADELPVAVHRKSRLSRPVTPQRKFKRIESYSDYVDRSKRARLEMLKRPIVADTDGAAVPRSSFSSDRSSSEESDAKAPERRVLSPKSGRPLKKVFRRDAAEQWRVQSSQEESKEKENVGGNGNGIKNATANKPIVVSIPMSGPAGHEPVVRLVDVRCPSEAFKVPYPMTPFSSKLRGPKSYRIWKRNIELFGEDSDDESFVAKRLKAGEPDGGISHAMKHRRRSSTTSSGSFTSEDAFEPKPVKPRREVARSAETSPRPSADEENRSRRKIPKLDASKNVLHGKAASVSRSADRHSSSSRHSVDAGRSDTKPLADVSVLRERHGVPQLPTSTRVGHQDHLPKASSSKRRSRDDKSLPKDQLSARDKKSPVTAARHDKHSPRRDIVSPRPREAAMTVPAVAPVKTTSIREPPMVVIPAENLAMIKEESEEKASSQSNSQPVSDKGDDASTPSDLRRHVSSATTLLEENPQPSSTKETTQSSTPDDSLAAIPDTHGTIPTATESHTNSTGGPICIGDETRKQAKSSEVSVTLPGSLVVASTSRIESPPSAARSSMPATAPGRPPPVLVPLMRKLNLLACTPTLVPFKRKPTIAPTELEDVKPVIKLEKDLAAVSCLPVVAASTSASANSVIMPSVAISPMTSSVAIASTVSKVSVVPSVANEASLPAVANGSITPSVAIGHITSHVAIASAVSKATIVPSVAESASMPILDHTDVTPAVINTSLIADRGSSLTTYLDGVRIITSATLQPAVQMTTSVTAALLTLPSAGRSRTILPERGIVSSLLSQATLTNVAPRNPKKKPASEIIPAEEVSTRLSKCRESPLKAHILLKISGKAMPPEVTVVNLTTSSLALPTATHPETVAVSAPVVSPQTMTPCPTPDVLPSKFPAIRVRSLKSMQDIPTVREVSPPTQVSDVPRNSQAPVGGPVMIPVVPATAAAGRIFPAASHTRQHPNHVPVSARAASGSPAQDMNFLSKLNTRNSYLPGIQPVHAPSTIQSEYVTQSRRQSYPPAQCAAQYPPQQHETPIYQQVNQIHPTHPGHPYLYNVSLAHQPFVYARQPAQTQVCRPTPVHFQQPAQTQVNYQRCTPRHIQPRLPDLSQYRPTAPFRYDSPLDQLSQMIQPGFTTVLKPTRPVYIAPVARPEARLRSATPSPIPRALSPLSDAPSPFPLAKSPLLSPPTNVANPSPPSSIHTHKGMLDDLDFGLPKKPHEPIVNPVVADRPVSPEPVDALGDLDRIVGICDMLERVVNEGSIPCRRASESSVPTAVAEVPRPGKSASVGAIEVKVSQQEALIARCVSLLKNDPAMVESFLKAHRTGKADGTGAQGRVPGSTKTYKQTFVEVKPELCCEAPDVTVSEPLLRQQRPTTILPPAITMATVSVDVPTSPTYKVDRFPAIASKHHAQSKRSAALLRNRVERSKSIQADLLQVDNDDEDRLVIDE